MQGNHRKLASISLASLAVTGSLIFAPDSALALSEQQILDKLNGIPVFLIIDEAGQPLTISANEEDSPAPIVFIDSTEAEAFIEEAESEEAEFADNVQVEVFSLGDIYAQANEQLDSADSLVYIPSAQSLYQASEILDQEVQGVPLYAIVDVERNQYLLTRENTLPMFFSLGDLRSQIETLVANNPDMQDSIGIEIRTFESILEDMADDDPELDSLMELVRFIPSSQTLEYVRSSQNDSTPEE